MQEVIVLKQVKKTYQSRVGEVPALEDISFDVREGEFLTVVGQSGCGKSTLLKIVAGLIPRTSGEVMVNGLCVNGPPLGVGMVFQSPVLFPWRVILQNIMLPVEVFGWKKNEYRDKALELIKLVGLSGFEDKYPYELSGGMQQRVSLCRALISDPSMLLMDEPFGSLDAITREEMNIELLRVWTEKKKTVLFVTHNIPEAILLADRVVVLTRRPACVDEILKIDLPRPRTIKMQTQQKFLEYSVYIREKIKGKF